MSVIEQEFILNQKIADLEFSKVEKARIALFSDVENIPLLLSNETDEDISKIQDIADKIQKNFKNLLILATGASESIPKILFCLGNSKLNVEFLSNVDQYCIDKVLEKLNPKETCILAISKSGTTIEIITLLFYVMNWIEKKDPSVKLSDHFYFITEKKESTMTDIAKDIGATIIEHAATGGRYSFFTSLGFLPAALSGFDINKIIINAKHAFIELIKKKSWVMQGAAYNNSMVKKHNNNVFISYGDRFEGVNLWIRQLIAESLGKNSKGITPITSRGIVDHHSQLQLYLDGPDDKFFTVLAAKKAICEKKHFITDEQAEKFKISFLAGVELQDVMSTQMLLSIEALNKNKKNLRIITANHINEKFISEFIMGMMLEVIIFAYINDIDPFGQPAVEGIKAQFKYKIKDTNGV